MDEELESLREKSTRASSVYDDLEGDAELEGGGGSALGRFTPQQWLILALLLFLDIVAFACAILIWTGRIF